MKRKYRVWQAGWGHIEGEVHEIEIADDECCPACRSFSPHPNPSAPNEMVAAYQLVDPPGSPIVFRYLSEPRIITALTGAKGWVCRLATDAEVRDAEEEAEHIRAGTIEEFPQPTAEERARQQASNKRFGEVVMDTLELFFNPMAWAARRGAELGAQVAAKKRQPHAGSAQARRDARREEAKRDGTTWTEKEKPDAES